MKEKKKIVNILVKICTIILVFLLSSNTVFATEGENGSSDPLNVINNLSTFIFGIIRAVGMILLGWAIVQIRIGFKKS